MPASLEKSSPCKVNLLLNILGRRPDGFHELESVMYPVPYCDRLGFTKTGSAKDEPVSLTCSDPMLPVDSRNLVHRAASAFLTSASLVEGVKIHLEKKIPQAAGLGGGSGNAATTLLGLNELFDSPLTPEKLHELAARLGSDIPFFLQSKPALATGRGERIQPLEPFTAMRGMALLLIHPGFGISTPWAYQHLAHFPEALNGRSDRAVKLAELLQMGDLASATREFYNSLEAPAFEKYPILALYQEFLCTHGAMAALMSGSGSTTFALVESVASAESLKAKFTEKFGAQGWMAIVPA